MQETILLLRQQVKLLSEQNSSNLHHLADDHDSTPEKCTEKHSVNSKEEMHTTGSCTKCHTTENTPKSVMRSNKIFYQEDTTEYDNSNYMNSKVLMQVSLLFHL